MPTIEQLTASLRSQIEGSSFDSAQSFAIARDLCTLFNNDENSVDARELLLQAMEFRDAFGGAAIILDGLIRKVGLFPYLQADQLSLADLLAYEAHRAEGLGDDIVFHRAQAHVFTLLMNGENVALSAPTSFGKSLLIDAAIASGKYRNIAIVVPTLALIDETRKRIERRFGDRYKVITRPSQEKQERNIYIFTQERVLDRADWAGTDFFVIDEFYKLLPRDMYDERSFLLNSAFYRLAKTGAQFYMLGPNIQGLTEQNHLRVEIKFISEPGYHTVATRVHRVDATKADSMSALVELCKSLDAPTIVFCRSPNRTVEVANELVNGGVGVDDSRLQEATSWIGANYHPEWHFSKALKRGIGVHHGRIPRALGQYVVRKFNDGTIRYLICTSTLIEGVNTTARNIIIFDNEIDSVPLDLFTFNNIKGRSGRMKKYFVGHVYVFHSDPQTQLPFVDVPAMSQSENMPDSLLVQLDEPDLTDSSRRRYDELKQQTSLSFDVIRKNIGIDPAQQIALAERIRNGGAAFQSRFAWSTPNWAELLHLCGIIFDDFNGARLGGRSARKPTQLAAMILQLRDRPSIREFINRQIKFSANAEEAVERTLNFYRLWTDFHLPKLLRAISNIQDDVLQREGKARGNYEYYASQIQSLFMDPSIAMMEEIGVPFPLAMKIRSVISTDGDYDAAIEALRKFEYTNAGLSSFEIELIREAISGS